MLEEKQVPGWASGLPTARPPSLSRDCSPATGVAAGVQPVHPGHWVDMRRAGVMQKAALLHSMTGVERWRGWGQGGSVLWWEAGEGWVRHGQVLGGGKEGDREGVLENNGRGR